MGPGSILLHHVSCDVCCFQCGQGLMEITFTSCVHVLTWTEIHLIQQKFPWCYFLELSRRYLYKEVQKNTLPCTMEPKYLLSYLYVHEHWGSLSEWSENWKKFSNHYMIVVFSGTAIFTWTLEPKYLLFCLFCLSVHEHWAPSSGLSDNEAKTIKPQLNLNSGTTTFVECLVLIWGRLFFLKPQVAKFGQNLLSVFSWHMTEFYLKPKQCPKQDKTCVKFHSDKNQWQSEYSYQWT